MLRNHEKFVRFYIKCHDQLKAYKKVYSTANKTSVRTGAARLMAREDIKAAIEKINGPAREKETAQLQETVKEQLKLDIIDNLRRRHECAQIILGKKKIARHFKFKDHIETVEDEPSPAALLRAIELDAKLEYGWHIRERGAVAEKRKKDEEPKYPQGCEVEIHEFEETDPEKILRRQWEAENPDKVNIDIIQKNESFTISAKNYLEAPPWQTDPDWYENQSNNSTETIQYNATLIPQKLPQNDYISNESPHQGDRGLSSKSHLQFTTIEKISNSVAICSNNPSKSIEHQSTVKAVLENSDATFNTHNESAPTLKGDDVLQNETESGGIPPFRMTANNKNETFGGRGNNRVKPTPPEEDYTPLGKTIEEYYLIYLNDQHSINYRNHQNLLKMYETRKLPKEERAEVEKQTGWQFHPDNYGYIRKIDSMKKQVPSKGI
jgi:hypothetical protein